MSEDKGEGSTQSLQGWFKVLLWWNFQFSIFRINVKITYREVVSQNFSTISQIVAQLHEDKFRIFTAAIKIRH
jgi:hypothetical protein